MRHWREQPGASDKSLTKGTCFILFIHPLLHAAVDAPVINYEFVVTCNLF